MSLIGRTFATFTLGLAIANRLGTIVVVMFAMSGMYNAVTWISVALHGAFCSDAAPDERRRQSTSWLYLRVREIKSPRETSTLEERFLCESGGNGADPRQRPPH